MKENGGASTTPREPVKSTSASPGSHPRAPSRNPTRDVDQQHGSGSCHDDTPHQAGGVQPEHAEYESAEHRTDDPEQQIHQHAVAAAAHQFASKPAGDDADDNLPEEEHRAESYSRKNIGIDSARDMGSAIERAVGQGGMKQPPWRCWSSGIGSMASRMARRQLKATSLSCGMRNRFAASSL